MRPGETTLQTYDDVLHFLLRLADPLALCRSPGGARVLPRGEAAHFSDVPAGLEGFARPLWGLAAAAREPAATIDWGPIRNGLAAGTDPAHPEFWGWPRDFDQRVVEMAAIGFALALAPDELWAPLPNSAKKTVEAWLNTANSSAVHDTNWSFFPVLVNVGLAKVGAAHDPSRTAFYLERIDKLYRGAGWYWDGLRRMDYYNAFAFHFYGLFYAIAASDTDPKRAATYRQRAAEFAQEFQAWFGRNGSAVPYGRSLTYRLAHAAFWGMLAMADLEALPWARIKGLYLRSLSWWAAQAITDTAGLLTVGYTYPNRLMGEEYNSPSSPYWAMKGFAGLGAARTHPLWTVPAEPAADLPDGIWPQPTPALLLTRHRGHVVALAAGQELSRFRQSTAKYNKFAYSSYFGFSVESDLRSLVQLAPDSTLVLWREPGNFKVRESVAEWRVGERAVYSRWHPWSDTTVETWLVAQGAWQLRGHRISTPHELWSVEGGFAVGIPSDLEWPSPGNFACAPARASVELPSGRCEIRDGAADRKGNVLAALPNTIVMAPRTAIPVLEGHHEAGIIELVAAVLGQPPLCDDKRFVEPEPDFTRLRQLMSTCDGSSTTAGISDGQHVDRSGS